MLVDVMDHFGLARSLREAGYFETEHHQQLLRAGPNNVLDHFSGQGHERIPGQTAAAGIIQKCRIVSVG